MLSVNCYCCNTSIPLTAAALMGTTSISSTPNQALSRSLRRLAKHGFDLNGCLFRLWQQLGLSGNLLFNLRNKVREDADVQGALLAAVNCCSIPTGSSRCNILALVWPQGKRPLELRALSLMLHEVQECLFAVVHPSAPSSSDWEQRQRMPQTLDGVNREQHQLLQAACWVLPELLLRTTLQAVPGEPLFAAEAAAAATWAVKCWHDPSMLEAGIAAAAARAADAVAAAAAEGAADPAAAAAAARATAAAGTSAADAKAVQHQLLPELLDCWLELMQQLLLQQYISEHQLAALLQQQWPNYPQQKQAAQQLLTTLIFNDLPGLLW
jgi:hypothetical protein